MRQHQYFVYILTNCSRHPFYTGVCRSILQRHVEHKERGNPRSYTAQYGLYRLVYFERHKYIRNAIAREKQIKPWSRAKKIALIESINPNWDDLAREWGTRIAFDAIARAAAEKQHQGPSTPALRASARDDKSTG